MDRPTPTYEPHRFRIGAFEAVVVSDGPFPVPNAIIAFTPPRQELDRALGEAGVGGERVLLRANVLAVDTGNELVLVDAGAGGAFRGTGQLLPGLRAAGIEPGDVGAVVLTHAHGDHITGLLDERGAPVFPGARYLMSRPEWDFWSAEPPLLELSLDDAFRGWLRSTPNAVLTPLKDRLELFEFGDEVVAGITALEAVGHTPGHTALDIRSEGEQLLHVADAVIHPVIHLRHTDWFGFADNWPARTVPTRRELLGRAAAEGLLVMASHFPFPCLGRVREDDEGGGFAWEPAG